MRRWRLLIRGPRRAATSAATADPVPSISIDVASLGVEAAAGGSVQTGGGPGPLSLTDQPASGTVPQALDVVESETAPPYQDVEGGTG